MGKRCFYGGLVVLLILVALTGCAKKESADLKAVNEYLSKQDELSQITIFYPSEDMIIEDTRDVEKGKETPEEAVRQILETKSMGQAPPVLPETKMLGLSVEDGVATINFDRKILDFKVPLINKQLFIAAITKTLSQFSSINQVKFQVEGMETGTIDGKDVENFWGDITLKAQPWKVK